MMLLLLILFTFFASIFATAIGFGSAVILIPLFSLILPVKKAIAILSIYFIFVTLMRAVIFLQYINFRIVILISIGAIPAVFLGLNIMLEIDANSVKVLLACVIIVYLVNDYFKFDDKLGTISHKWTIFIGSVYGFFNGIIGIGNPIIAAFLMHIGLRKRDFIANMATCSIMLDIIKSVVLTKHSLVTGSDIPLFASVISVGVIGTWLGKFFVDKLDHHHFKQIVRGMLFVISINLLWQAVA